MSFNKENTVNRYDKLAEGNFESWEVYTGETAGAMAQEEGIPRKQWIRDTVAMQAGQDLVKQAMAQAATSPETTASQELQDHVKDVIHDILESQLRSLPSDDARKGLLAQILVVSGYENPENLAALSRMEIRKLREKMENAAYTHTIDVVLPALRDQCALLMQNNEQTEQILKNAGALAAATYLEYTELRDLPQVIGASAQLATSYAGTNSTDDTCFRIATALFVIAAIIAALALLYGSTSILVGGMGHLLMEGTVTGIGAAIAEEVALGVGFVVGTLKAAAGTALVASVFAAIQQIFDWNSGYTNTNQISANGHHVKA